MAKSQRVSKSTATAKNDPLDSPVMRQYLEIKKSYPEAILFFRMGDFYEMFLEDAETAAPLMDIALTRRQNSVPMAGVPFHSVDTYLARLIGAGRKVAIAEQEIDPENPKLMHRRVRRVVSPGTLVEDSLLESSAHNYLMAIRPGEAVLGLAFADVSTGEFFTMEISGDENDGESLKQKLRDSYFKYGPREVIVSAGERDALREILPETASTMTPLEDWKASPLEGARRIETRFGAKLKGLGYESDGQVALGAASLVLHYLGSSFPEDNFSLVPPVFRRAEELYMALDEQTIRNLDLIFNQQEGGRERTLYGILNGCRTAVGKRRLRDAIITPLIQREAIETRLNRTRILKENSELRREISSVLDGVYDLERSLGRLTSGRGAPRDFSALTETVRSAKRLSELLGKSDKDAGLGDLAKVESDLRKFAEKISRTVREEPPAILGNGPFLKETIDADLDRANAARENGSRWVLEFEAGERKRTGLSSLKVKYNKVVGYFIEISKGQAGDAPPEYVRKQTLVGNERFSSEKLAELETTIQEADQVIERVEKEYFEKLSAEFLTRAPAIRSLMNGIAEIDLFFAFAEAAARHDWIKPVPTETGEILIEDGRHPVVEAFLEAGESFIPNSVKLDSRERSFAVLTGPNMAGKSTYIRQTALLQLMMQIGSFVPARHATLSVADRVFTRIGSGDNLTRGESTFFVEMLETARILNQATEKSLIIMDEVGRGTSTYDGLSIAWAVTEYFTGDPDPKPRALFATHYHELTALEKREGVFNLTMDVEEREGKVIFLHRVREGPADRSYGIHVAELAGLPPEVIERSREKLEELEREYRAEKEKPPAPAPRKRGRARTADKTAGEDQGSLF